MIDFFLEISFYGKGDDALFEVLQSLFGFFNEDIKEFYIGLSGACRIPMMTFEASFMGITFTGVRIAVTVPLIYLSSIALAAFLGKRGYELSE